MDMDAKVSSDFVSSENYIYSNAGSAGEKSSYFSTGITAVVHVLSISILCKLSTIYLDSVVGGAIAYTVLLLCLKKMQASKQPSAEATLSTRIDSLQASLKNKEADLAHAQQGAQISDQLQRQQQARIGKLEAEIAGLKAKSSKEAEGNATKSSKVAQEQARLEETLKTVQEQLRTSEAREKCTAGGLRNVIESEKRIAGELRAAQEKAKRDETDKGSLSAEINTLTRALSKVEGEIQAFRDKERRVEEEVREKAKKEQEAIEQARARSATPTQVSEKNEGGQDWCGGSYGSRWDKD